MINYAIVKQELQRNEGLSEDDVKKRFKIIGEDGNPMPNDKNSKRYMEMANTATNQPGPIIRSMRSELFKRMAKFIELNKMEQRPTPTANKQ